MNEKVKPRGRDREAMRKREGRGEEKRGTCSELAGDVRVLGGRELGWS